MSSFAYIFDLNNILEKEDLHIPHVEGLHYNSMNLTDLNKSKILEIRDVVMSHTTDIADRHLFFFVIENDKEVLKTLSKCFDDIQNDQIHFNQNCELHVVCNFIKEDDTSFNIKEYEEQMPSLTKNVVCVYSWLLDKYEFNGVRPVSTKHRAHAIVRLVWMLTKHYNDVSQALLSMTLDTEEAQPIYNLFGDACVFFDEEKRNKKVSDYYCFKNLQHLLNLPDRDLDIYLRNNVLPYANDKRNLEKRIDATSEDFLQQQRVPIEATLITEKTQGLLLKSSDEDEEYLVSASDNNLVFLEELRKNNDWQLEMMEAFLTEYQNKVSHIDEIQDVVSDEFLNKLYYEKYIIHERDGFDRINNVVSNRRKTHIDKFKKTVDNHLNGFLNQQSDKNYAFLQDVLIQEETNQHHSNIDYGIAFMEYLESGKGDYLADHDISMGDISFSTIKDSFEQEERKRFKEYEDKKNEIKDKYQTKDDGLPSKIKEEINILDQNIKRCHQEKNRCEFQIEHWIDEDADKKLTARSKSVIAFSIGVLVAIVWVIISKKYLADFVSNFFEHYGRFQWTVFSGFIITGLVIGTITLVKAFRRLKEAEEALERAQEQKKRFMNSCVEEMKDVTKKHYEHLLAYHGLKTMKELLDFVTKKKEDLVNFRNTLFKMMLRYRLSADDNENLELDDENTIELTDEDNMSLLFGPEENRRNIPYCFAQDGIVLSKTFADFKRKKTRWETTRSHFSHISLDFDQAVLENEVIPCMHEHEGLGLEYTALEQNSVLPVNEEGIEMDDIHQGQCGDCYFMATLAAIAQVTPEYIVGKNGMIEELGEDHRFFRVKFYDEDGERVNVDVDNKFWNKNGQPYYAGKGKSDDPEGLSYDPWVMAVEKAWAKTNDNGYDGIEGSSVNGKEYVRKVEYSFAVTGKSAYYCMTKNVPDRDKLLNMMKKHFLDDHLPITLYSAHKENPDFPRTDPNLVNYHAYAVKTINREENTFDIFNPWNSHSADENVKGKHYEKVDINFIGDNFEVIVFFGIQEADFDSFERDLTQNAAEDEMGKEIEAVLLKNFDELSLHFHEFGDLLTDEHKQNLLNYSIFVFSRNKIIDQRGVGGNERNYVFLEGVKQGICDNANMEMFTYMQTNLPAINHPQQLHRDDDKLCLTVLRLSPHYVLANFRD